MIDTHAHIDTKPFDDDRADVLERAWAAGIQTIVIPAIKPDTFHRVRETVALDPRIVNGAGVHPHHAHEANDDTFAIIEAWCTEPTTVAVGEIGLDYYYDFCPRDIQKDIFRRQLQLAKHVNLPVIVHNRESDDDLLEIIKEEQDGTLRGVLHCFSSGLDVLHRALDCGMHVSFTGNITFKQSTLDQVVQSVPIDRFMIETDSPYITPVPHRGKRNEPQHVLHTAQKIAEIRGMTLHDILERTTATARAFFALPAMLLVCAMAAIAQPSRPNEDDFEFDEQYDRAMETYELDSIAWAKWIRPKSIGIGFTFGTNTVVESQQFTQRFFRGASQSLHKWENYRIESDASTANLQDGPRRSFSFEGLSAIGATLTYSLTDRFTIEGTYLFSNNTGPAEQFGLDPITTQIIETSVHYNLNPYSKVNFIANGGASFSTEDNGTTSTSKVGVNVGLALGVNIPTPIGLFYPMFNVRFNFMLGTDIDRVITRYGPIEGIDVTLNEKGEIFNPNKPSQVAEDRANVTTIFSIPRLTILYYPNLW